MDEDKGKVIPLGVEHQALKDLYRGISEDDLEARFHRLNRAITQEADRLDVEMGLFTDFEDHLKR